MQIGVHKYSLGFSLFHWGGSKATYKLILPDYAKARALCFGYNLYL